MGIINVSPESFSGDGVTNVRDALAQAHRLVAAGADILDIGGESTKPGSSPITVEEEIKRVVPVVSSIAAEKLVPVSVDTYKLEVAAAALESGAAMLNDQWGLKKDKRLAEHAARWKVPVVLMSNQRDKGGYSASEQRDTGYYQNVTEEVISSLNYSIKTALEAGILPENIIIDPGIGFGKTWQQDCQIIRCLRDLQALGKPILVGPSRKSLIKMVLNLPPDERIEGTAALVAISIANGADMVRVHDVKEMVRVCRMADAVVR